MSKLAQWKNRNKNSGIPKLNAEQAIIPSFGQQRLCFLMQLTDNDQLYQYGHIYEFADEIEVPYLENRLNQLIVQQDILRSNFIYDKGELRCEIHDHRVIQVLVQENLDPSFFTQPFDLEHDMLIRVVIFEKRKLAISIHHIIADRQSLELISAALFGEDHSFETLPLQHYDFASWYNQKMNKDADLSYWKSVLPGNLPIINLPTDFSRPTSPKFAGKTIASRIPSSVVEQIHWICKEEESTIYTFLLATFKILLARFSNQDDIIIGTPISNRDRKELSQLVGFFNETLPIRNQVDGSSSIKQFLSQVKESFISAIEHKNVTFDHLVNLVNPERSSGANPIFQTMFLYNKELAKGEYSNELLSEEIVDLGISKFDLTLFATESNDEIELRLEFSTKLFKDETAWRFLDCYQELLAEICVNPNAPIRSLKIGSVEEDREDFPEITANSILELIDFDSETIAAATTADKITYSELDRRSNLLAAKLLNEGLQKNEIVGLHCPRGLDMMVGIIGIIKAGGAYLPLDPSYPMERLEFMVADSDARFVVSDGIFEGVQIIDFNFETQSFEEIKLPAISKDDLVYMIYTSGSEGRPKGVPISHENLLHSTSARFEYYEKQPESFLLLSSFSFDSSIAGIFWTLCSGGKLILPPEKIEQDVHSLGQLISAHDVTHSLLLPSLYQILLDYVNPRHFSTLQTIVVAGEACNTSLVKSHFEKIPSVKLFNEYGPTEATVWCIAHQITERNALNVPIGKAIPYYHAYILNEDLSKSPNGVVGEIFIGGQGLSSGYWKDHTKTAIRFIEHPEKGRLYRTGDLGVYDAEGQIYFKGRKDTQVKIRGHRVELEEVRKKIIAKGGVNEAVVLFRNNRLLAFTDQSVENNLDLPDYMIPSEYIVLEEFPRLPNGKIDHHKLKIPNKTDEKIAQVISEERSEIEQKLSLIWSEVLNKEQISIHENFFDIGGDSLATIKIVALAREGGIQLSATQLFEYPTIQSLAKSLEKANEQRESDVLVTFRAEGSENPLFCIHGGGGHVMFYQQFAQQLSPEIPVYSFQPQSLDGRSEVHLSIENMAQQYVEAMRDVQPAGPYKILGTCFSNAVALEMANQLTASGESIEKLFIIDSAPVHLFGNNEGGQQTLMRFWDMLKRGDFRRITSKIKSRFSKRKQWESPIKEATDSDIHLKLTIESLNKMYADYNWKPFEGKIHFIRSSEFSGRPDKKYHITQWSKLAKMGIDISVVDGHHLTLFEEPEVLNLAEEVSQKIISPEKVLG